MHPLVVAGPVGTQLQTLRQLYVSPGHFSDIVVLAPGTWRFVVTTRFGSEDGLLLAAQRASADPPPFNPDSLVLNYYRW